MNHMFKSILMQHVENTISLPEIGSCSPCQGMSNSLLFQYDTNINLERNVQSYFLLPFLHECVPVPRIVLSIVF